MKKLLSALFRHNLHTEKTFFIKKTSINTYRVHFDNGYTAAVEVENNSIFVNLYDSSTEFSSRYFFVKDDPMLSDDLSVILSFKKNLLSYLNKSDAPKFVSSIERINNQLRLFNKLELDVKPHFFKCCFYQNELYPQMCIFRKKIINQVYRFGFNLVYNLGFHPSLEQSYEKVFYYLLKNELFELSNFSQFMNHVRDTSVHSEPKLGICNQFNGLFDRYHLQLSHQKIKMLKKDNAFCLFSKINNKIVISNIKNFSYHSSTYSKDSLLKFIMFNIFKRPNTDGYRSELSENNGLLQTYTYSKGKFSLTNIRIDLKYAQTHQYSIFKTIDEQFNKLRCCYPEPTVFERLAAIGIDVKTPLPQESLDILDMYEF